MVDAVPTPTPTPLLDAIRARAEICVLRTTLSAEMACGVCAANVRCLELERVCMRIDLVSRYSLDAANRLFTESDALRRGFFPPDPLAAPTGDGPPVTPLTLLISRMYFDCFTLVFACISIRSTG